MSSNKSAYRYWDHYRNRIYSRKGGWKIGEAVYNHGYSMMDELVGEVSFFQLLLLNITGKIPSKNLADWLEGCFICLSWPDSRIWCNQMAALAGSAGTKPVAAVSAGIMASDSLLYGPGVIPHCMNFITESVDAKQQGFELKTIVEQQLNRTKTVPGYARPIAKGDERVIAMREVSKQLGFTPGTHELLAEEISDYLADTIEESINFGGYMVAFLADQGITVDELTQISALWVSAGVQACYAEAIDRPAGSYLPLRCSDVIYTGVDDRALPARE